MEKGPKYHIDGTEKFGYITINRFLYLLWKDYWNQICVTRYLPVMMRRIDLISQRAIKMS